MWNLNYDLHVNLHKPTYELYTFNSGYIFIIHTIILQLLVYHETELKHSTPQLYFSILADIECFFSEQLYLVKNKYVNAHFLTFSHIFSYNWTFGCQLLIYFLFLYVLCFHFLPLELLFYMSLAVNTNLWTGLGLAHGQFVQPILKYEKLQTLI